MIQDHFGKPTAKKISDNETCRNWDPTDENEVNPWRFYQENSTNNIENNEQENVENENNIQNNENATNDNTIENQITNLDN